ncbi:MAG: Mov34/MPN/PAD-1 family protein [Candidatus Kariarchaeaceae archaeon]|jgi:proteasome lid subunit RPN8/RPN11
MNIILPKLQYEKILTHGEEGFPEEICGVFIGLYIDGNPHVKEARRMKNTNSGSRNTRYNIDPMDLIKLEDEIDAEGLEMLGIYHSHPNHPARPSQYDFDHAWPNISYAVLKVQDGKSDLLTSWRLKLGVNQEKQEFVQENIIVKEEK